LARKTRWLIETRHITADLSRPPCHAHPTTSSSLPFRIRDAGPEYAVFYRGSPAMAQFIAGGGEDDENPLAAARRETREETGSEIGTGWIALDSTASIPRTAFPGAPWPDDVYVVPEIAFAVEFGSEAIRLSAEHERFAWLSYEEARKELTWDSNRVALFELRERLNATG